jgi:phenylpyruvate tautomerase PptA (4-oxalocrotonate tautomerase family)
MPFITCDLEEGLTDSEKRALVTKMTEITHRCIGSAMEHRAFISIDSPIAKNAEGSERRTRR